MIGTGNPLSELGGLPFTTEDRLGELFLKARLGWALTARQGRRNHKL